MGQPDRLIGTTYDKGFNPFEADLGGWRNYLTQLTLHYLDDIEKANITNTEAGKVCLCYSLVQGYVMRKLLADPAQLRASHLLEKIESPEEANPSRKIDLIGGEAAKIIVENLPSKKHTRLYIEEEEEFLDYHKDNAANGSYIIVVDPLDGTSNAAKGVKAQSSGIVITDNEGKFLAGSVASLVKGGEVVEDEVLLVDDKKSILFKFDEESGELVKMPFIQPEFRADLSNVRLGLFGDRIDFFKDLVPDFVGHIFPEHGGYTLLAMILGNMDAMLDPKGEAWAEIILWGYIAQQVQSQLGLFISIEGNDNYDFSLLLRKIMERGPKVEKSAIKVRSIISGSKELHQKLKEVVFT